MKETENKRKSVETKRWSNEKKNDKPLSRLDQGEKKRRYKFTTSITRGGVTYYRFCKDKNS